MNEGNNTRGMRPEDMSWTDGRRDQKKMKPREELGQRGRGDSPSGAQQRQRDAMMTGTGRTRSEQMMHKGVQDAAERKMKPNGSLRSRQQQKRGEVHTPMIIAQLRDYGIVGTFSLFLTWLNEHQWVSWIVAVASILVGMMVNKYVSAIVAVIMVGLGYASESQETDNDSIMIYVAAMVSFIAAFIY